MGRNDLMLIILYFSSKKDSEVNQLSLLVVMKSHKKRRVPPKVYSSSNFLNVLNFLIKHDANCMITYNFLFSKHL